MRKNKPAPYSIDDLFFLMARLRDPERGCPWDLEQTASDIINYSIEEVYELADAIERSDSDDIADELGDVLFQTIFLARLGEERGDYDFSSIVHNLCDKLIRRHPHVFTDGRLYDDAALQGNEDLTSEKLELDASGVKNQWEAIKQQERGEKNQSGLFDNIPLALPAINRAAKLQKRAAKIGLDWPDANGPLQKVHEEYRELVAAVEQDSPNQSAIEEELGDLLFSIVNLGRKLGIDPEQALRNANRKFVSRATSVEQAMLEKKRSGQLSDDETLSAEAIDEIWRQVKRARP